MHTPPQFVRNFALIAIVFSSHFMFSQTTWNTTGNTTNNNTIFGTLNNQPLIFYTNGVETMRLKANGELRVNNLSGTGNNFVFSNSSGVFYTRPFTADTNKFMTEAGVFRTASSFTGWKMVGQNIHSVNGTFVGIGNTNPQYILDVNGDVHFNGIVNAMGINIVNQLQADTIKGATLIKVNNTLFLTGGTQNNIYTSTGDLRLQCTGAYVGNTLLNTGNGNVGVGIFSPQYKLDVNGDERVSGKLYVYRILTLPGDSEIHFGDSTIIFNTNVNRITTSSHSSNQSSTIGGLTLGWGTNGYAYGVQSLVFGTNVKTSNNANNAIVMGSGETNGQALVNNIPNSLMIGFGSSAPTIFVAPALTPTSIGKVGIGTTTPAGDFQVADGTTNKFLVRSDGRVVIGSGYPLIGPTHPFEIDPFTRLIVDGRIMCKDVLVSTTADWPDYVFDSTYVLMPLDTVSQFIQTNNHLPGSIPAANMEQDGFSVSETAIVQQKQIEEMMLYILQINERIKLLEAENARLKTQGNK